MGRRDSYTIEGAALCWHPDPVPALAATVGAEALCLYCLLLLQPLCTQTGSWLHCCYCYSTCLQLQTFTLWCPKSSTSDCSSAVALEMHACVGKDQHLCCLLFPGHRGISTYVLLIYSKHAQ